jgi:hypothetical protein
MTDMRSIRAIGRKRRTATADLGMGTRRRNRGDAMNRLRIRLCVEWLLWCFDHGWSREFADILEDIFWTYDGWKTFSGYMSPPKTSFKFSEHGPCP